MAFQYNLDQNSDVGYFDHFTIGPNREAVWWFQWGFDDRHWQRLSFAPVDGGVITIVSEWVTHDVSHDKWGEHHVTSLWARLRNETAGVVTVAPMVLVVPTRYRR
jgi:hypothetical protein